MQGGEIETTLGCRRRFGDVDALARTSSRPALPAPGMRSHVPVAHDNDVPKSTLISCDALMADATELITYMRLAHGASGIGTRELWIQDYCIFVYPRYNSV